MYLIEPYSLGPDRSIAVQPKIYISDNGIVNQLAQVSSGALFENSIANQLLRLGNVQYFQKKTGQEIDFILDGERAIEVKETPSTSDMKTLQNRAASLGIKDHILVGRYPPGSEFHEFVWGGCIF